MRHARYRGRHRAPSTAKRVTAAGAVGIGTAAITALVPGTAHAATNSQWDRVAQCESGGNWHADTGNGYYGGLQFAAQTWRSFGGAKYAGTANHASAAEQMTIADKVLKAQGWHAWPVCSRQAGVSDDPVTTDDHFASQSKTSTAHTESADDTTSPTHHETYTVKHGDTLSEIAHRKHVKGGWKHLFRLNHKTIGSNPDNIVAGEKLKV
jgi:resuscitation-promoting factor RpfA